MDLEDLPELVAPETSVAPVGDAVAECVAQALRSSRWFTAAASSSGQVAFHTVFGAQGILQVADEGGDDGAQE